MIALKCIPSRCCHRADRFRPGNSRGRLRLRVHQAGNFAREVRGPRQRGREEGREEGRGQGQGRDLDVRPSFK